MRLPGAPAVLNSDQGRVAFVMGSLVVRGVREWLFSEIFPSLLLVASLLLVVRPGAPSSFLFLVARPGAPVAFMEPLTSCSYSSGHGSVHAPSKAMSTE